jgi:hypothetical protein
MAHELYHAVQGAYVSAPTNWWSNKDAAQGPDHTLAEQCSTNNQLFSALYEKGTASNVGDAFLLRDAKGMAAKKRSRRCRTGLRIPQTAGRCWSFR